MPVKTRSTSNLSSVQTRSRRGAKRCASVVQPVARKARKLRKTVLCTTNDGDEKENQIDLDRNAEVAECREQENETREDDNTDTEDEEEEGDTPGAPEGDCDDDEPLPASSSTKKVPRQETTLSNQRGVAPSRDHMSVGHEEDTDDDQPLSGTSSTNLVPRPVTTPSNIPGERKVVTEELRDSWRSCLVDIRSISIRHTSELTRPKKTMNSFVTKATVFLAYLLVHAEVGKPFPKIPKRFELDVRKHDFAAMGEEISKSRFNYTGHWNRYHDPHTHIGCNLTMGTWLANTVNKAKYVGTWNVGESGEITGVKNGLYEPYKELLEKVGVRFDQTK